MEIKEKDEIIYSLEGHNSKYGVCQHTCNNGVWVEFKNCCCGSDQDNDWYICGNSIISIDCNDSMEGLVVYTNCYLG